MAMALKADVALACRASGTEKPINLVHLSSMTMGDRKLEIEILKMFANQMTQFLEMIDNAANEDDVRRSAHTIKGAARSIGALKLADIAEAAENKAKFDRHEITCEMDNVRNYISEIDRP